MLLSFLFLVSRYLNASIPHVDVGLCRLLLTNSHLVRSR